MVRRRLGTQFHEGIKKYHDALVEDAFHMQLLVDSLWCNKDTLFIFRSSCCKIFFIFFFFKSSACVLLRYKDSMHL